MRVKEKMVDAAPKQMILVNCTELTGCLHILDRIVHKSHVIQLKGESMREVKSLGR